jgi:hypothetical protein
MIGQYQFGKVTIDGIAYDSDVIVYSDHVEDKWWRKDGHHLCLDDLKGILGEQFDTLVVGTGYFGRMKIDPAVPEMLKQRGITFIAHTTAKACTEFNRLKETQKVIGAFHLTC